MAPERGHTELSKMLTIEGAKLIRQAYNDNIADIAKVLDSKTGIPDVTSVIQGYIDYNHVEPKLDDSNLQLFMRRPYSEILQDPSLGVGATILFMLSIPVIPLAVTGGVILTGVSAIVVKGTVEATRSGYSSVARFFSPTIQSSNNDEQEPNIGPAH